MLCSVVSDYRGKHYPGSRECQLPCTAPAASPGSTHPPPHPPPMLQQEAAPTTQGLQVPNRLAWAGLCTPLRRPPALQLSQHSMLLFAASRGGGEGSSPVELMGSILAEPPRARLGLPGAAEALPLYQGWHRHCDHSPQKSSVFVRLKGKEKIQLQQ